MKDEQWILFTTLVVGIAFVSVETVSLERNNGCDFVGRWSDWSECKGTSRPSTEVPETKIMTDKQKFEGKGQRVMQISMHAKLEASRDRMDCLADVRCHKISRESRAAAICENGMAGGFPCRNVDLKAFINFVDLGFENDIQPGEERSGSDMWGWKDTETNDNYVIMGTSGGSSFVRITNPEQPEVLGFLPTHSVASLWRDMKVVKDYVYIVSEARDHGMQIFDLTQLRGLSADSSRRFVAGYHYNGVGSSHNIVGLDEADMVAIVGATQYGYDDANCRGGLHMVDVSDPKNVQFLGCWSDDSYIHDAHCLKYPDDGPDANFHGRYVCLNFAADSFAIVDITNPGSPTRVSRVLYTGCIFSHQGWASEDLKMVLLDDELDELYGGAKYTQTYVFDITDMANPVVRQKYLSAQTSIDHNQYIIGNYSHQSNYEAGYRLLEINTKRKQIVDEVAYFDVFPSQTRVAFGGTWSNYPWFEDGIIPVSSIEDGLYILQVNWAAIHAEKKAKTKYHEKQRFRDISGTADVCPEPAQIMQC